MQARPIPRPWIDTVLGVLESNDPMRIEWTFTAVNDWKHFGLEQDAYKLLIKTLGAPIILGHQVIGMLDARDGSFTDCWAFLCPHPWDSTVPLYAKIGIHHTRVYINLFSLHVDDGSEKLQAAIAAYWKKHKK